MQGKFTIYKITSNTVERALEAINKEDLISIMKWLLCRSPNQ